jgi:hypothetical protein
MPSISVPTAIIGASVIGAGASMVASGKQASAAKAAANAQVQAAKTASDTELNMFNQTRRCCSLGRTRGLRPIPP